MEKIAGPGGAECYRIAHESGSEVTIAQHGGHIISWKTADGIERLYLSEIADFSEGKAIRGGVPVIFPQFNANGPYARHGFARKTEWTPDLEAGVIKLASSEATRALWPFDFEILIGVQLSATTLEIELTVHNTGTQPFPFQAALHTYFSVNDATKSTVTGLDSIPFHNEVTDQTETASNENNGITFGTEIDRSYRGVENRTIQICDGSNPSLQIVSTNFPDCVVWNPGPGHGIGDLPLEGWKNYLCVESAQVDYAEPLAPGNRWHGTQRISVFEE